MAISPSSYKLVRITQNFSKVKLKGETGCITEDGDSSVKLVMVRLSSVLFFWNLHHHFQVGDSGVGKSCLLNKLLDNSSTNNFISTIGVDIRSRETVINNKKVKIQV